MAAPTQAEIAILIHRLQTGQGGTNLVEQKIIDILANPGSAPDTINSIYEVGNLLVGVRDSNSTLETYRLLARDGVSILVGAFLSRPIPDGWGSFVVGGAVGYAYQLTYDFIGETFFGIKRLEDGTYFDTNATYAPVTLNGRQVVSWYESSSYQKLQNPTPDWNVKVEIFDNGKECLIRPSIGDAVLLKEVQASSAGVGAQLILERLNIQLQPVETATIYTVKSGDTLSALAQLHDIPQSVLQAFNPQITNPNSILAGEQIYIPLQLPYLNGFNNSLTVSPLDSGNLPNAETIAYANGLQRWQLQAANPGVDLDHLSAGQTLNLPSVNNR